MTQGDTVACEFCGAEFGDEPELFDHWFQADPDVHDLDDEQWQAMVDEQVRQMETNEVRVNVKVEIPRDVWEWAVDRYDLADPRQRRAAGSERLPESSDRTR